MIIKGNPNEVVGARIRFQGRLRYKPLFRFDSKGFATVDITKYTQDVQNRILANYECLEEKPNKKARQIKEKQEQKDNIDIGAMNFFALKSYAREKGIKFENNIKKIELLKLLGR